jgi:hypothetical protein
VSGHGHSVYNGKWHGDVVIHTFSMKKSDKRAIESYFSNVKALMHIRHENIVSFMGASTFNSSPKDLISYTIITNPVRAESLHAKSGELANMDVTTKMSIASQVKFVFCVYTTAS